MLPEFAIVGLLVVYAFCATSKVFFHSRYSKKYISNVFDVMLFWLPTFIFIGLLFLIFTLTTNVINTEIIIYALLMGFGSFLFQLFYSLAFKSGPVGLSVFIISLQAVVMPIYNLLRFNEPFDICKIIALCLLVIAFIFNIKKDPNKKPNVKWIIYIALTFASQILCSIVQTEFSKCIYAANNFTFLSFEYLFAAGFCAIFILFLYLFKYRPTIKLNKDFSLSTLLTGITLAGGVFLLYFALQHGNTLIIFPIQSGLCMLFSIGMATVVYKEKFRPLQWVALVCGLAAVILINF